MPVDKLRRRTDPENLPQETWQVDAEARGRLKNQRAIVLWLTGLSGSGKSTIAKALERRLFDLGHHTYVLDGDNLRRTLNRDLGFSAEDRAENIRRSGAVAQLMVEAGLIVICAFISPFRADREAVRASLAPGEFVEVFVDAPLAVCQSRDPKGLYAKARAGLLREFTGIDSPYEAPDNPDIVLHTDSSDVSAEVEALVALLDQRGALG